MKLQTVTTSTARALRLDDVKTHLRLELGWTEEDAYLKGLIGAAQDQCEIFTNRKLLLNTIHYYLDDWPETDYIELPYSPMSTGTAGTNPAITYTDVDSSSITFASSVWKADSKSEPGRIYLDYGESWPTITLHNVNPISIEYKAGYGTYSSNVPLALRHGMLMNVGHWYENREETLTRYSIEKVPLASKALWSPYRVFKF
jgi:uncharacterized phiE125 gp8 family phage protein